MPPVHRYARTRPALIATAMFNNWLTTRMEDPPLFGITHPTSKGAPVGHGRRVRIRAGNSIPGTTHLIATASGSELLSRFGLADKAGSYALRRSTPS